MRMLGLILLIGGLLIMLVTNLPIINWVLIGLGAVMIIASFLTGKK